jgi:hypothetical protein
MNNKKKILLGDKDILSKENEDLFLNINLSSTFSIIRSDKYENVFDVEKQFKKERNSSRSFRIYGIIDSTVADCGNLTINIFANSGTTGVTDFITGTTSTTMAYDNINVYGKKRGKFVIELDNYEHDYVYLQIPSNNLNYKTQTYSQQLVFRDADGNFVEYGTQTIDINENGDAVEINNDFYFLFNKHWIKKDLLIVEEKPAKISINSEENSSTTNEFTVPADRITIGVVLDKPSPFGLERANLNILTSTLNLDEVIMVDGGNTVLPFPHTVSFAVGEQNKLFFVYSPLDTIQEFVEDVVIGLEDFQNVSTGTPLQHQIFVQDKTSRNKVKVNFQGVYQNRNYFTGRVFQTSTNNRYSYKMPSVLRNGLFFEGTPMEFYPSDNYTLKIKNVGVNTILPINQVFGITEEKLFLANEELTFNITQEYQNVEKNSIKLTFGKLNAPNTDTSYYSLDNGFRINGIPFVKYGYSFRISYNNFLAYLKKAVPPNLNSTIDGWSFAGFDTPFDITEDVANLTLTLTSKNPGTRLDLSSYGIMPDLFSMSDEDYETFGIKAEIFQEFVYGEQIPLIFELSANFNNNNFAQYKFTILKTGYDGMSFTCSPMAAGLVPDTYYLASGLNTILRNWDDSTSTAVFRHDHVTSDWGTNASAFNPVYGSYKTGDAYINGMVLLANQYLSNTVGYSSNPQGMVALNQTHAINSTGDFAHDLFPEPIIVIAETTSELAITDRAQSGFLGITRPSLPTLTPNLNANRSFEFRTGITGPYNTYKFTDFNSAGQNLWSFYNAFLSSGGTVGTNHITPPALSLKTYMETGNVTYALTDQGLIGVVPISTADYNSFIAYNNLSGASFMDWIKITMKTPGIPFEFKNFIEMQNTSTNTDYYANKTMKYLEFVPSQKAGIDINLANNKMGGFAVVHP